MDESSDYTVLVVEDDPNHQLLIKRALEDESTPYSVVQVARDSHEAERFAKQMPFDCLLVDNRIPGKRGLDLIDFLRNEGIEAPCVLMTSAGTEDLVVQAYRKKVNEYVIKEPGFWKELPQILLRIIREDRSRRREVELGERLVRTNEKLDRLNTDVQLQNQQLRQAQQELEERNREQGELSARLQALIDDIQPPLAEIAGAVEALLSQTDELPAPSRALIDQINEASQRIGAVVAPLQPGASDASEADDAASV